MSPFLIFPGTLTPDRRKIPLISGWKTLASNDPVQIKSWQEQFRERITHWCVPTGRINDLLVLDIDKKPDGTDGWKSIEKQKLIIPDTMSQRTMNGGTHYLFKYPRDGREHGNRVGMYPGLDIRGDGGFVFFYGTDSKPIVDPPSWLITDSIKAVLEASGAAIKVVPAIAHAIIEASLEAIREASPGEGNNTLNVEAFKVMQLVVSGSVNREHAEMVLYQAAKERGRGDYEIRATIESAFKGASQKPLTCPFGDTAPVSAIQIPELLIVPAPPMVTRWTPGKFTRDDLLNTSNLRKPQLFQDWSSEDITICTADGGTGKSTLTLYESICLALGDRFLGFNCVQPGKTLFITGEDSEKKLGAMLGAIIRQMGLFENVPGNSEKIQTILDSVIIKKDSDLCLILKEKGTGFLHMNSDALRKVLEAVDDIKPKMIVFDPISSFWGSEAALNDMNKAVIKFVSALVDHSNAAVVMINHMGKQSSSNKDITQFAGRGGSGLPSNARVSRVLHTVFEDEYSDLTGETLGEKQSAMKCVVTKFTDGSPLVNKPFLIVRDGYLFTRKTLTPQKAKEAEESLSDMERVFTFIKQERSKGKYPIRPVVIGNFMGCGNPISEARTKRALDQLQYSGQMGQFLKSVANPDMTSKEKVFVIADSEGREI